MLNLGTIIAMDTGAATSHVHLLEIACHTHFWCVTIFFIISFFHSSLFPLFLSLLPLAKDLHGYLKQHSLSEYEVTRYQLVQVLLKLTRTELSSNTQLKIDQIGSVVQSGEVPMWACAWACLDALCQPLHGPVDRTVLEVRGNSTFSVSVSLISKKKKFSSTTGFIVGGERGGKDKKK